MSDIYYAMKAYANPTATLNPANPMDNDCFENGEDTILVIERRHIFNGNEKRTLRALVGSGGKYGVEVGEDIGWVNDNGMGHRHDYYHHYRVVGIHDTVNGVREGHLPNRKIPHFVMK